MIVEKYIGATAPTSPELGNNSNFFDMVNWFYKTPNTISIDYCDIDDRLSNVVIVTKTGDERIKTKSITIGPKQKEFIRRNYLFYKNGH